MDLLQFVAPDRVPKSVNTDEALFDAQMERVLKRIQVDCGHESQLKAAGEHHALGIGRRKHDFVAPLPPPPPDWLRAAITWVSSIRAAKCRCWPCCATPLMRCW